MKKAVLIGLLLIIAADFVCAREKTVKGCTGGMMVHTGYLSGCDNPYDYNTKGVTFGVGGLARVQLGNHFRVGFEGYVSTLGLKENISSGSHNKVFWTGLLCDWFWKSGRFYPYAGVTVGGGMETSYLMFSGDKSDWLPEPSAVFHKEAFLAFDPFVGIEYELRRTIRLNFKLDYLVGYNSEGFNRPSGPRLYIGIIFAH